MIYLSLVLVSIVLVTLKFRSTFSKNYQYFFVAVLLLGIAGFTCKIALTMKQQIDTYPEWDFSWFWLYGKIAIQGLNFIDPNNVRELAKSLNYSIEFINELDFPYLPPTIFLFTWLGYFDFKVAYGLWYILQSAFLILDTVLLQRIFFPKSDFLEWASITVLLLSLPGTSSNFYLGQTHTILLGLFLLFWKYYNHFQGGIYLALGVLVKPWLIFFLLYIFLKRRWTVLLGFLITLSSSFFLTILCFGITPILEYFFRNPSARSIITYIEPINQSLLATILRITRYEFSENSPLAHPIYIFVATALLAVTSYSIFRLKRIDLALSIILMLALLIYPGTLAHYSLFLIIPILLVYRHSDDFFCKTLGAVLFVFCQYVFSSYENLTFVIFLLDWLALVSLSFVWLKKPTLIQ
jgi:Glycosyltransferase family 87